MKQDKSKRNLFSGLFSFKTLITPSYIKVLHYAFSILSVLGYLFIFILMKPANEKVTFGSILLWIIVSLVTIIVSKISSETVIIKFKQYDVMRRIEDEIKLNNINDINKLDNETT